MIFPSIDIQGSIISSDLLGKIRSEQANYQQGKNFIKDFTNAKLKDEISSAWQDAKGQWLIFQNKLARLKEGETATTETRTFWLIPLLSNLGYNLNFSRQAEELNGKSFPINYRDSLLDGFPVYIAGFHESLDKRPENKQLRVSPHAMVQEYLNYSEHLYGLVTNGRQLRLLRDANRITRLSYVEFNLQKMMEEDLYSDFVLLYRLLHESRMPRKIDGGAESIIEKYHQEGLEAGSTIRDKLGNAVKESILELAKGFINHPDNTRLRSVIQDNTFDAEEFYHHQLRIIYRLLFLFVIEERNLVYADSKTSETKRFGQIYFNYYSLLRLRKLARKLPPPDAQRHYDLWQSLLSTFTLFENKKIGERLGIMALYGDIFSYDAINGNGFDLHQCRLSNDVLLKVMKALGYFENENGVLMAVNYGGLDVEEFGSVYEGLLELKLKIEPVAGSEFFTCNFDTSRERGKSGSHYTPEELVQPLIKHSLDYLIADKLKEKDPESALLSLKVCDVACGSGHILLSAARRIAHELACLMETKASGSKEKVEQPSPAFNRKALKQVVRQCIYGVDKNPLAVELCKVALWLEAHNPGEPLNFLDHHIKCGDSIVGLAHREELENGIADETFKTLPGDEKDIAQIFSKKNKQERKEREDKQEVQQLKTQQFETTENSVQEAMVEYKTFNQLPETTPDEIERKAKNYKKFMAGKGFSFLKAMADTQVAQFFIPKTTQNKDYLISDAEFRLILSGYQGWQEKKVAKASVVSSENRFFHWFLEFPEVSQQEGFDCILGNPPFLGGQKLSGNFGNYFLEYIKYNYAPIGAVDLVTYFFRRDFTLIRAKGFQSLISTNTIAQGNAREDGLDVIVKQGGSINHAVRSMKWPGAAAVEVALVTITKQAWKGKFFLSGKEVKTITPYLDDAETLGNPFPLKQNENKSFQGSIVLGKGFVLEPHEAMALIAKDPKNKDVLFPYLNGDDLNNNPDQSPSRWVINFFDWPEEKAKQYPDCYVIIERLVKPERIKMKGDRGAEYWWQFLRMRSELYRTIASLERVLCSCRVSKYVNHSFLNTNIIFDVTTNVVIHWTNFYYSFLQSNLQNEWAWKYASSLESRIRYLNVDCIDTFPFPQHLNKSQEQQLETIGEAYHEHRKQLMLQMQLGLTKTYNAFHAREINEKLIPDLTGFLNLSESTNPKVTSPNEATNPNGLESLFPEPNKPVDKKTIEKKFGKEVWNLYNHLQKTPGTISLDEAIKGIIKLRELHVEMDNAVLEAYGWRFDSAQRPDLELRHNFYEVDYLPENDRTRYTIHPDARKEVLKRLLELNHKIHDEELKAGLWEKKKTSSKAKKKGSDENQLALEF